MSQEPETPPISGNDLPLKELKAEGISHEPQKIKGSKNIMILSLAVAIFALIIGLVIGILIVKQKQQPEEPMPSGEIPPPSVFIEPTPQPDDLEARISSFETELNQVEFEEQELTPPNLNFKIRFPIVD